MPSGTPNEEFLTPQAIRSIACSTASTRGPRGSAVEELGAGAYRSVHREANRPIHPPIKRTVRNCPHAGQAVPSGTPNEEFLTIQAIRSIACSTASTRGPRGSAVEERGPGAHRTVRREANRTIHPPIKRTVRNYPHAGRAVTSATPSEWYYLKINRIRKFSYSGGGGSLISCVCK